MKTSSKTRLIKYAFLGAGICLFLATFLTITYSRNSSTDKAIKGLEVADTKKNLAKDYSLNIQKPVFEGFSDNLKPYKILADTVMRDKNDNYVLQSVSGKCSLEEGDVIMQATNGTLNEIEKQLRLTDDAIIIFNGIEVKSSQIDFNINTKNISSDAPVMVDFLNSHIKADKLESEDSCEIIRFRGNVISVFGIEDFKK